MKRPRKLLVALATLLLVVVCAFIADCVPNKRDLPPLGRVTSAELGIDESDGSSDIWKISDPQDLSRVVAFVDSRRAGWRTTRYGIPAPHVHVRFFDGDKSIGDFGAGPNFFGTQRNAVFFSKDASPDDVRAFYDVVHVDEEMLKKYAK